MIDRISDGKKTLADSDSNLLEGGPGGIPLKLANIDISSERGTAPTKILFPAISVAFYRNSRILAFRRSLRNNSSTRKLNIKNLGGKNPVADSDEMTSKGFPGGNHQ